MELCLRLGHPRFRLHVLWGARYQNRKWHWITPGAAFGITLWIFSTVGLRIYLHFNDSYSANYGSVGAVIILLLCVVRFFDAPQWL
ncbi:MAG: YihY/virulence factor BrkB family protein [Ktedonobacteraceae bacterium]|nr:YihY/virulence factor BrkB family protein [Ktedonobacteraceae bacterium]